MPYSTLLLDLDHTLFDSDASEAAAFDFAMQEGGVSSAPEHARLYREINLSLWAAVERGEMRPQQVRTRRFELLVQQANLDADPLRMADAFVAGLAAHGDLYPGAREVVEALNQRATLALVTNGLSEVQRARIERLGIGHLFDAIVISAEVEAAKPGTRIFDIVFSKLSGPEKSASVMIGDSLSSDIRGGSNYGIATCWYNPNGAVATADDRIDHEIRELRELLELTAY